MTRSTFPRKLNAIIGIIFFFGFNGAEVSAQNPGVTNRPRIPNVNRRANPSQSRTVRTVYSTVYRVKETTKFIKPTGLTITTVPGAEIIVESVNPGSASKVNDKADALGTFNIENLKPGKYRLSASLQGYQPGESEISIVREKIATIHIPLKKVTYDFSIQTNVARGEVRFAPVKVIGPPNPDGTLNVQETGGYCVVPIENQRAIIRELPEGTYNIDVRAPEAPEYQPELAVIEIPLDIPEGKENQPDANASFKINLENKLSIQTFNQLLVPSAWELPANWQIEGQGLKASGAGVALPKDQSYRFYKDFEMQSSVRLLDNISVGFAVRAKDSRNFYLIQLTGGAAGEPYLISGYVVTDGKPTERVLANPIKFLLDKNMIGQKYFTVIIKARGNVFEVFAEDSLGTVQPLGNAVFKDSNFPIGAVGIGVTENSNFEVGRFTVCSQICR